MRRDLSRTLIVLAFVVATLGWVPSALPKERGPDYENRIALATTTIIWDLARNVAGDLWRVEYLVEPGRDPHTYEPSPQDMIKAAAARLVFYNGYAIDLWVTKLVSAGTAARMVRVTEGLDDLVLIVPDGPYAGRPDPHMWMDVRLAIKYVERIRDAFIEADPKNEQTYRENAKRYIGELLDLDDWIRSKVSELPAEKRLLFTQENAFQYFARAYGFKIIGYFYSIVTEIEPPISYVSQVARTIRESGLCIFFVESTLSPRVMEVFARETNGRIGGRLYTDSLGALGSGQDSYVGMMRYNVEKIVSELKEGC